MAEDTKSALIEEILPPQPPGAMKWIRDNLFSNCVKRREEKKENPIRLQRPLSAIADN